MIGFFKSIFWRLSGKCKFCGASQFRKTTQLDENKKNGEERKAKEIEEFGQKMYDEYIAPMASNYSYSFRNWNLKICTSCDKVVAWW